MSHRRRASWIILRSGPVAPAARVLYYRHVKPPRELLLQLARLIGVEAFTERLGRPQTAEADDEALRALIEERLDHIARRLVEEAAASDDVIDSASAAAYLEDRLRTLGDVITPEQAERLRAAFAEATAGW